MEEKGKNKQFSEEFQVSLIAAMAMMNILASGFNCCEIVYVYYTSFYQNK